MKIRARIYKTIPILALLLFCNNSFPALDSKLGQIYQQNTIIIKQLENLSRLINIKNRPVVAQTDVIDIPLLVLKQMELGLILAKQLGSVENFPMPDMNSLDVNKLLIGNQFILDRLPALFQHYQKPVLPLYYSRFSLPELDAEITSLDIFDQFLRIETLLFNGEDVLGANDVYVLVRHIRSYLPDDCKIVEKINSVSNPLIMGKRPRDVYKRIHEYLNITHRIMPMINPQFRPNRILPHDVFDLAIIAMRETMRLSQLLGYKTVNKTAVVTNDETITPSHVYKAVVENIEILECLQYANT